TASGQVLHDHHCDGGEAAVAEREQDLPVRQHLREAPAQKKLRPAVGRILDPHIMPAEVVILLLAQALDKGLLGGETGGHGLDAGGLAAAVGDLLRGENAADKMVAPAVDGGSEPVEINDISADGANHVSILPDRRQTARAATAGTI